MRRVWHVYWVRKAMGRKMQDAIRARTLLTTLQSVYSHCVLEEGEFKCVRHQVRQECGSA